MTTTILSIVCIVLVALCLYLWVYARIALNYVIDAQRETERVKGEAQYFERQTQKYSDMCLQLKRGPNL